MSPSKIWRPTPQYRRGRRAVHPTVIIELASPEQREELKARAAEEGVSMNALAVGLIAAYLEGSK